MTRKDGMILTSPISSLPSGAGHPQPIGAGKVGPTLFQHSCWIQGVALICFNLGLGFAFLLFMTGILENLEP